MEKYRSFKAITSKYLDGKLVGMNMSYPDTDIVRLQISYEVNSFFTLDYEVEVDAVNHKVNFLSHGSHSAFDKIKLKSEPKFDLAVSDYFFGH